MHETALMNDLMNKLRSLALEHGTRKFTKIRVRLGALSHFTASHFKEHFLVISNGTPAESAELETETSDNIHDPHAKDVELVSVEMET